MDFILIYILLYLHYVNPKFSQRVYRVFRAARFLSSVRIRRQFGLDKCSRTGKDSDLSFLIREFAQESSFVDVDTLIG